MKTWGVAALAAVMSLSTQSALAQEVSPVQLQQEHAWNPSLGVRVGGYGFRQLEADGVTWLDCRMDGSGLFGTVDLSQHFFLEGSFDFYAVSDWIAAQAGEMDRVSMHLQSALGFRMLSGTALVPYLQAGAGAEWTRVQLSDGRQGQGWYPTGFFAFGTEYGMTEHLSLGGSLRVAAMPHPVHDHQAQAGHSHEALALTAPQAQQGVRLEYAPAGQALFYVRYSL